MIEKFLQANKARILQDNLNRVDQSSADVLAVERSVYAALAGVDTNKRWAPTPISPFAEPINLNDLVGDLFLGSREELRFQAQRVDNVYSWLNEVINVFKAEVETAEKAVLDTTDAVQTISIVVGDENKKYYWVSDSFNNNVFVDKSKSTCLVDTDYGQVILTPQSIQVLDNFSVSIDTKNTKGIPGANLLVLNLPKPGTDKEPQPVLETSQSKNISNLLDSDPTTWFEIERNFIAPKQNLIRQGRAFIASNSGKEDDILTVTKNLDWKVSIQWPDGSIEDGDGTGVSLAEFVDFDSRSSRNVLSGDFNAKLVFDAVLDQPTEISSIQLAAYKRNSEVINIDSIQVLVDNNEWIEIVKDVELGSSKSTTQLQREILKRTGSTSVGSIYAVPTDRLVSKIRFLLSAPPQSTPYGLAHPFQEKLTEFRTERHYVIFSSVDHWQEWARMPFNATPPRIVSESGNPKLIGSILDTAQLALAFGNLFSTQNQNGGQSDNKGGSTLNSAAALASGLKAAKIGGTLGSVGNFLSKAAPILGAVLALNDIVGGLFNVDHSETIKETRKGYDVFNGFRAAVALRDLTIARTIYQSESVLQTVRLQFPGLVSKVGIFVEESIPNNWGQGDWIVYYLSVDGTNWTQVSKLSDTTIDSSYTLSQPSSEIYMKAILKGNPSDVYHTPALLHYALQGEPV